MSSLWQPSTTHSPLALSDLTSCHYWLEARLLVNPWPEYKPGLRSLLAEAEQRHHYGHPCCHRQHYTCSSRPDPPSSQQVKCHLIGQFHQNGWPCRFRLHFSNVTRPTNPMPKSKSDDMEMESVLPCNLFPIRWNGPHKSQWLMCW